MELRSIKENEKKEYPKLKEVKSKKLKKCIPSKWSKIGITSFMLGLILKSNVYAATETDIAGGLTVLEDTYTQSPFEEFVRNIALIISIASAIGVILSLVFLIKNIIKNKKENNQNTEENNNNSNNSVKGHKGKITNSIIFLVTSLIILGVALFVWIIF